MGFVSDTQIIVVLAVAAVVLVIFGCLILVVVIRLRRMVNSQLKTLNNLLSVQRADQERDTPREPS
jgi:signal transduction histidine kinase